MLPSGALVALSLLLFVHGGSSDSIICSDTFTSAPPDGFTAVYGPITILNVPSRLIYPDPILQLPSIIGKSGIAMAFWLRIRTLTEALPIARYNFLSFQSPNDTQLAFQCTWNATSEIMLFGVEFSFLSDTPSKCRLEIQMSVPTDYKNWILLSLSFSDRGIPTFKVNGTDPGPDLSSYNCTFDSNGFPGLSQGTWISLQAPIVTTHTIYLFNFILYDRSFPSPDMHQQLYRNYPSSRILGFTGKSGFRFYRDLNDTIRTTSSTMDPGELIFDGPVLPTISSALNLNQQFNQGNHQFTVDSQSHWFSFWIKLHANPPSGTYSRGIIGLRSVSLSDVKIWLKQTNGSSTIVLDHPESTNVCSISNTLVTRLPVDQQYHHVFVASRNLDSNKPTKRVWTLCVDDLVSCISTNPVTFSSLFAQTFMLLDEIQCSTSKPTLEFSLRQLRAKEFSLNTFDLAVEFSKVHAISFGKDCAVGVNGDLSLFPPSPCYGHGSLLSTGTCLCNFDRDQSDCHKCGTNFMAIGNVGDPYFSCQCSPGFNLVGETCTPCANGTYNPEANGRCMPCPAPNAVYPGATKCGICPSGTFTDSRRGICIPCAPGTYSSAPGSLECQTCPDGKFSNLTSCMSCAPGYYRQEPDTICRQCPIGRVSAANGTSCLLCDEGTYAKDFIECVPCASGFFSNQTGQMSCLECPAGHISSRKSRSCSTCSPGMQPSADHSECLQCPIGRYSFLPAPTRCFDCPPGKYTDAPGRTQCFDCPPGSYSFNYGSSSCSACPANSFSILPGSSNCSSCQEFSTVTSLGSESQDNCLCFPQYFHNLTADARGYKCNRCLPEFICSSLGMKIPGLLPGYFRDMGQPYSVLRCSPEKACAATTVGNSTICSTGYNGFRCSSCSRGYYRYGSSCIECQSGVLGPVALLALLSLGCAFLLQIAQPAKHPLTSIGISFSNLQLISVFGLSITNRWNSGVSNSLGILSILNLNVNVFRPGCNLSMDYLHLQQIQLFLPLVAFFELILLSLTYFLYISKEYKLNQQEDVSRLRRSVLNRLTFSSILLMLHGYTIAIATSTDPLNCEDAGAGRLFMKTEPSIECSGKAYDNLVGRSLMFFAIYALSMPSVVTLVLLYHYHKCTLFTEKFRNSFGALTSPYQISCFWWELVQCLRKMLIVLASNIIQSKYMQLFAVLSVLFVAMVLQIFYYPYRTLEENRLSIMWNIVSILILFSAGVLEAGGARSGSESLTLDIMIFFSLLLTVLYSFYTVWTEIRLRTEKNVMLVYSDVAGKQNESSFFMPDTSGTSGFNPHDSPAIAGPTATRLPSFQTPEMPISMSYFDQIPRKSVWSTQQLEIRSPEDVINEVAEDVNQCLDEPLSVKGKDADTHANE